MEMGFRCRMRSIKHWMLRYLRVVRLPHDLKPPLRTEPTPDSPSPLAPPGPRWCGDRGALPDEPMYFLDGDCETAQAMIASREVPGGGLLFDVLFCDGVLLGTYGELHTAARAAEHVVDSLCPPKY